MEKELIELYEAVKKAADAVVVDGGAETSPEEDRCLDGLKRLEKFPVNYQVLVSTQVGKRLRHLTKHPRKKIQALASELIEIWKKIIIEETTKNGSLDSKDTVKAEPVGAATAKKFQRVNSVKVESVKLEKNDRGGAIKTEPIGAQTAETKKFRRVNSMKVEKVSNVESVKLEKNELSGMQNSGKVFKSETISTEIKVENVDLVKTEKNTAGERIKVEKITKEEKQTSDLRKPTQTTFAPPNLPEKLTFAPAKLPSMIYCKDPLRDKIRELLSEALQRVSGEVDEDLKDEVDAHDPIRVAVSVESAMFEKWGKSNAHQKVKYRSIMFNIKDPQNPDFRRKVLLGHVTPESILEMTPEEMASNQRQLENDKIKEKALFECERAAAPKATTDEFQCGRCKKYECTYYQLQTRSADEPMTTFVTCVNCNNHWKFC